VGQPIGAQLSSSLGKSGTDVKSPVCLIVVPTRELGADFALVVSVGGWDGEEVCDGAVNEEEESAL